jgi:hypothetical protein
LMERKRVSPAQEISCGQNGTRGKKVHHHPLYRVRSLPFIYENGSSVKSVGGATLSSTSSRAGRLRPTARRPAHTCKGVGYSTVPDHGPPWGHLGRTFGEYAFRGCNFATVSFGDLVAERAPPGCAGGPTLDSRGPLAGSDGESRGLAPGGYPDRPWTSTAGTVGTHDDAMLGRLWTTVMRRNASSPWPARPATCQARSS